MRTAFFGAPPKECRSLTPALDGETGKLLNSMWVEMAPCSAVHGPDRGGGAATAVSRPLQFCKHHATRLAPKTVSLQDEPEADSPRPPRPGRGTADTAGDACNSGKDEYFYALGNWHGRNKPCYQKQKDVVTECQPCSRTSWSFLSLGMAPAAFTACTNSGSSSFSSPTRSSK